MNDGPSVSILVPVYKVEKYLSRCIESVLSQDFTDWELILVDDGSPDRCPEICDEYAQKDERIRVVHKENGGLVSARLAGFKEARGEYLMFLDSDDYLFCNAVGLLFTKIKDGYDLVRGSYRVVRTENDFTNFPARTLGEINEISMYREKLLNGQIDSYMWGGLVRKTCYSEEVFRSVLDISVGEDITTNYLASKNFNKIFIFPDILYNYYMNEESIMHRKVASHQYLDRMFKTLESALAPDDKNDIYILQCYENAQHINFTFYNEVGFDKDCYLRYRKFIKENGTKEMCQFLGRKFFLWGINCRLFHKLFSKLYGYLLLYHRYKGNKRKLIY
ncbi:MAG: glycosyltransferase [Paraprevotella sp.]|nr:glycosyltransferase [Paraprevotella sp.]